MMCEVMCFNCKTRHRLDKSSAQLYGPVLHVYCPNCRKRIVKNLCAYVWEQVSIRDLLGRYEQSIIMVALARMIERELT